MAKFNKRNIPLHLFSSSVLFLVILCVALGCAFIVPGEVLGAFKSYRGVIYAGNQESQKVALMINVYWGDEHLEKMLSVLNEEGVKCTFFVGQTWAAQNSEMLKKIYSAGHEIGNHGSNHYEHAKLSLEKNLSEIEKCHKTVKDILNIDMNLFAPPGGSYSSDTVKAAESLNYKTILWTHDTIDWRDQDEGLIFSRATKELQGGDLILMHPTKATASVLRSIIEAVKSKKLTLDTVSNTIKD